MSESLRAYTIVVDLALADQRRLLDGLQRVGARTLLLHAVPVAMRQAGLDARAVDVDVSPAGALVVVQFQAESIEAAERSAHRAVGAALRSSEYLSAWRIVSSESRFDLLRSNVTGNDDP